MNSMTAALLSGQIDEMSTYVTVGNVLTMQNRDLEWTRGEIELSDLFCCALREEDVELKKEFDYAILKISSDGTLTKLVKKYISDTARNEELPAIEMPAFYGEPTIKIGVTGDLPLLDYIRADGLPAGFNTAVLAEISEIIGKNFVLVQIESGARAIALTSKQVDVIFWAATPETGGKLPPDFDKPEGVILTAPYFSDEIIHLKLKK